MLYLVMWLPHKKKAIAVYGNPYITVNPNFRWLIQTSSFSMEVAAISMCVCVFVCVFVC